MVTVDKGLAGTVAEVTLQIQENEAHVWLLALLGVPETECSLRHDSGKAPSLRNCAGSLHLYITANEFVGNGQLHSSAVMLRCIQK